MHTFGYKTHNNTCILIFPEKHCRFKDSFFLSVHLFYYCENESLLLSALPSRPGHQLAMSSETVMTKYGHITVMDQKLATAGFVPIKVMSTILGDFWFIRC